MQQVRYVSFAGAIVRRKASLRALSCAVSVILASTIEAQTRSPKEAVTIASTPVCAGCSIVMERKLTIGMTAPGKLLDHETILSVDRRGRFYAPTPSSGTVHVFDSTGRFLRSIGRSGGGPGEFSDPAMILFAQRDTMHVIDIAKQRRSVFTPEYGFIAAHVLPTLVVDAAFAGRYMVLNGMSMSAQHIGDPLLLIDSAGRVERTFGAASPIVDPRRPFDMSRMLAPSQSGTFWSAWQNKYVIERWDTAGTWLLQITRAAAWFKPWIALARGAPRAIPPTPRIIGVQEDNAGRLWVLIPVADANWKPHPASSGTDFAKDYEEMFDTIIEVIDYRRRELVLSQRVKQDLHFVGNGLVQALESELKGSPKFGIWRLGLRNQTGEVQWMQGSCPPHC